MGQKEESSLLMIILLSIKYTSAVMKMVAEKGNSSLEVKKKKTSKVRSRLNIQRNNKALLYL